MPSGSASGVPMSSGNSSSWLFLKMKPAMWAGVYWNWTFGAFSLTVTSLSPGRLDGGDRGEEGGELRARVRVHVILEGGDDVVGR